MDYHHLPISKLKMAFPKTFHICVEGTIGVGKSTFLSKFTDFVRGKFNILTLPEPVGTWTNYGRESRNLLDLMYRNEPGASLHFQILALLSKVKQVQNLEGLILSEMFLYQHFYSIKK